MKRADTLEAARKCVCGERDGQYGSPENNFKIIADLWNGYLGTKMEPFEVAVLLSLVKIARIKASPCKADSWVDLAGYAACGAEVTESL